MNNIKNGSLKNAPKVSAVNAKPKPFAATTNLPIPPVNNVIIPVANNKSERNLVLNFFNSAAFPSLFREKNFNILSVNHPAAIANKNLPTLPKIPCALVAIAWTGFNNAD